METLHIVCHHFPQFMHSNAYLSWSTFI